MKKIDLRILSSLDKIYHNDILPEKDYTGFSMLLNEKKSFQFAVIIDKNSTEDIIIDSPFEKIQLYSVEYIKSDLPVAENADDYFRCSNDGYYPDLLVPIGKTVNFKKGINFYWVEIESEQKNIGKNEIKIKIDGIFKSITVDVIDCKLDFKDFIYTNWLHTDCLMSYYKIDAFSNEYWRITESFIKTACDYGMNCVLTPIFTPPLDTEIGKERPTVQLVDVFLCNDKYSFCFDKLTKWIDMCQKSGIKYFELSHFFTQWGAYHAPKIMATVNGEYRRIFGWDTKSTSKEYKKFLNEFSIELKKYIENKGLKDKVILHVSDEPNFAALWSYSRASKMIHKLFKGYKIVDALSDIWFYKLGIVSTPIPSNDHIENFINKTDELWTYYCCSQNKKYVSNRFFSNSSLRTRVLGYQMFKYNVKGFLHWGYNFYFTQLSKECIDPYKTSDAGGKFPSGDSYIVYPAPDGTAYHSIRLKAFYDALQDMAALNTLEKLTDKQLCLNIIEDKIKISFSEYPHSDEWLLSTREKINSTIKENMK